MIQFLKRLLTSRCEMCPVTLWRWRRGAGDFAGLCPCCVRRCKDALVRLYGSVPDGEGALPTEEIRRDPQATRMLGQRGMISWKFHPTHN